MSGLHNEKGISTSKGLGSSASQTKNLNILIAHKDLIQ